jgi:glycosyltransferase involved in cell wall biosynthesis
MRLLAERNHVIWVNYHASRRPRFNLEDARTALSRLYQARRPRRRVASGIDVVSPLLIPCPESSAVRAFNMRVLAARIRAALRRAPDRPMQLWLFTPDAPELIDLLPAERVVYYCVDEFSAFSGFNRELIERLERRTIAGADAVITTSTALFEFRRRRHANTHLIPHGVDVEHFASCERVAPGDVPADVRDVPRPIFGYFGVIGDYVDLELLEAAAGARPDWSFVLIGQAVGVETGPLARLSNVHLLGPKRYELLPRYCRRFDVGLIPFRMNRLTRAVNPIKLREYLAAGLPVISAPMTEVLRYRPAVQTARSVAEFIRAGEAALSFAATTPSEEIRALVASESWQARLADLHVAVMGGELRTESYVRPKSSSTHSSDAATSSMVQTALP